LQLLKELVDPVAGDLTEMRCEPFPILRLTRSPDNAELPIAAAGVRGDLSKPDTVRAALDGGVEAVLLIWPLDPISACHEEIARLIEHSGMRWTFLRPSGFATNTLIWAPQIRRGDTVRWPYGAARRSLIDERDIAAVAARVLLDGRHAGERHALTGPQPLSQVEQLEVIGEAIGRRLRYEEISPALARQALLRAWGVPRIAASLLPPGTLPRRMADGMLAAWARMTTDPEPVTDTVRAITGRPAHTFADWAHEHAAQFR